MRITKYIHSCVLVEDNGKAILFCPGEYSWRSGLIKLDNWPILDCVVITHEHADHFDLEFVKAIIAKFPQVKFVSTKEVVNQLKQAGIENATTESDENVDAELLAHESMEPLAPPPCENIRAHVFNKVTHPGDSHHLTEAKDVLLLPGAGPWGSTIEAVRMADKLKPKIIVPIHDWMWTEEWRSGMYDRMEKFFGDQNIRFLKPTDGQPIEI